MYCFFFAVAGISCSKEDDPGKQEGGIQIENLQTRLRIVVSPYLFDLIAHHPAKKIYAVYTLVHQGAAVLFPCSPPRSLIVVSAVSVPSNMYGAVRQLPESPVFQSFSEFLYGYVKPVLVTCGNLYAVFFGGIDDRIRSAEIGRASCRERV